MKSDVFCARGTINTDHGTATISRLSALEKAGLAPGLHRLPFSIKILQEAVLRSVDDELVTTQDVRNLAGWRASAPTNVEVPFTPARVLLQDLTGVPAVVDLASMRAAVTRLGACLRFRVMDPLETPLGPGTNPDAPRLMDKWGGKVFRHCKHCRYAPTEPTLCDALVEAP